MRTHHVRVRPSADAPPREEQLAWRIAEVAADPVAVDDAVIEMVINRVIDNAAVSAASLHPRPGHRRAARRRSAHPVRAAAPRCSGSTPARRSSPEWAAWANGVAVRELDYHDTFLAAEYSHPGDNIPPILAVAQHVGRPTAATWSRGIATGYEIQIDLVRAICLHKHKIDHVAHLGPSAAAGIGTAARPRRRDDLPGGRPGAAHHDRHPPVAQGRDLHLEGATPRRSPARWPSRPSTARCAARTSPSPIYEGEDGVIAWLLDGPDAAYDGAAARPGEAKRGDPRHATPRSTPPSTRRRR